MGVIDEGFSKFYAVEEVVGVGIGLGEVVVAKAAGVDGGAGVAAGSEGDEDGPFFVAKAQVFGL